MNKVQTQSGVVIGVHEGQSIIFKGVPYAAPPVGPLRFSAPQPHLPWDGELICDKWPDDSYRVPFKFGKSMIMLRRRLRR